MTNIEIPGLKVVEDKGRARGELLSLCLSGSHAYGLNHAGSDFDLQGVYRAPTAQVLQIWGRPKPTIHEANKKCPVCKGQGFLTEMTPTGDRASNCVTCGSTGDVPDFTIHELGKFFELASKANPTVLEVMYLEPIVDSVVWDMVVSNRDIFISTLCRNSYGGYAQQQLHKKRLREEQGMEGYSAKTRYRDTKHTRHIVRLFIQERQLLEEGTIFPMLDENDLDTISIAEKLDSDKLEAWMNEQTLQLLKINNNIPPMPDTEKINELLLTLRGF